MNAHVAVLTPTQAEAIARRRAFQQSIADRAAQLAGAPKQRPTVIIKRVILDPLIVGLPDFYFVVPKPDSDNFEPSGYPRVGFIQEKCARHFRIALHDMVSDRRTLDVIKPRQIAMYLARELTKKATTELGRRFGGKDHTTILHAHRKIAKLVAEGGDIARAVAVLTTAIMGEPAHG